MKVFRLLKPLATVAVLAGVGYAGYETRDRWLPHVTAYFKPAPPSAREESGGEAVAPTSKVIFNEQAQLNLGLTALPLKAETYWKTIPVPGMVVDRPGLSDRGVSAPVTGIVTKVSRLPGDAVRAGDPLFTLRVMSEQLHQAQTDLFKTTQDIGLSQAQRKRLMESGGAVPEARLIEVDNQIARFELAVRAYRQELLNRGFTPEQIDGAAAGRFVTELVIRVPAPPAPAKADTGKAAPPGSAELADAPVAFEVQELKVDLGQPVQPGQVLCLLANHQRLSVEGRAFRDETPLLERSVKENWPVEVDFQEDAAANWGAVGQTFRIRHLANTIDPVNRTFAFQMPLENQSKVVEHDGRTQTLWRFRPGQRVRLHVRVSEIKNVLILPADAVAREGADAYVFTQNVNTFDRRPVRVLLQERDRVLVANDGALPAGIFVVQGGAVQLNRMVKSGGSGGAPKGYHIHADGSLHKNEDEGK